MGDKELPDLFNKRKKADKKEKKVSEEIADQEMQTKFLQKMGELLELAKKKKKVLEYQEINDFFKETPLSVDEMEKVWSEKIKTRIKEMGEFANKELGQNYLINQDIAKSIVDILAPKKNEHVLEIGAGFGALSVYLLMNEYKSLTLNEIDPRAVEYLEEQVEKIKRVYVINKSALKIDVSSYQKVVGNLPYYISNDLIDKISKDV